MKTATIWLVSRDEKLAEAWGRLLSREHLPVERLEALDDLAKRSEGASGLALVELDRKSISRPAALKYLLDGGNISVIVVASRPLSTPQAVAGVLECGADDFILKEEDERVLLAKVKAHLRRVLPGLRGCRAVLRSRNGELEVDRLKHVVRAGANGKKSYEPDRFTPKEFDILSLLVGREEEVVSRGVFMEEIWREKTGRVNCETLDKHVETLRHKLGVYGKNIRTVYGQGYVYRAA